MKSKAPHSSIDQVSACLLSPPLKKSKLVPSAKKLSRPIVSVPSPSSTVTLIPNTRNFIVKAPEQPQPTVAAQPAQPASVPQPAFPVDHFEYGVLFFLLLVLYFCLTIVD